MQKEEAFVRLTKGVDEKGSIVRLLDVEDRKKLFETIGKNPNSDWYRSLFYYDLGIKTHTAKNNGSVAGYRGKAFSDRLVFDFDKEGNIEIAKKDVLTLLHRLVEEGVSVEKSVAIYFSGNKGFHVEVLLPLELTPEEMKSTCSGLAAGLTTFDGVIYNHTRLFRISNTLHAKTGLFKVVLPPTYLGEMSVEDIQNYAREKRPLQKLQPVEDVTFLNKYKETKKENRNIVVDVEETASGIRGLDRVDFSTCPRSTPRCIFALTYGVMKPGEREVALFRLATYYKNQGLEKRVAYRMLKGIAELNRELYPEADVITKNDIWTQCITSAYASNGVWKSVPGATGVSKENELLKRYCDAIHTGPACAMHAKPDDGSPLIQIGQVAEQFTNFAENMDKNIIHTGIGFLDKYAKITTNTTNLIVGSSGSGKTTLLLNVLENSSKSDITSVFFSLDMQKNLVFLKLAQKVSNHSQDQIIEIFNKKQEPQMSQIKEAIDEKYKNVFFDFSNYLSLDQMKNKVQGIEQKSGKKVKLVSVDYASRIASSFKENYANASHNALRSVEIAELTAAAWIFIAQISRANGGEITPLRTKRVAKDSSSWEETNSVQINQWRPFYGTNMDNYIRTFIAKNRLGEEKEAVLYFNKSKGLIRDLTEEEKADFDQNIAPHESSVGENRGNNNAND